METLDDDFRVLFEVDKEVLIFLDSLELPVRAAEQEVEVELGIAGELDFETFTYSMKLDDHDLDSDFLKVFESLYLIRFFLHAYDKIVLFIVDNLSTISNERIFGLLNSLLFFSV